MKKLLFGIFAHPDDEAFGPSASLYHAAQNGTDVHLILLTDGESGNNPDEVSDLAQVRLKEWEESGAFIGVKSQHALHYPDGGINNNLYLEIAEKILAAVREVLKTYSNEVSVDFMTYEQGGITGHLDHIAASYITTFVYLKLRKEQSTHHHIQTLKYYCLPQCLAPETNTSWLYMTCGKADAHCDEIFDYTELKEIKLKIMKAHRSQRDDMQAIVRQQTATNNPCRYKDHFCYFKP